MKYVSKYQAPWNLEMLYRKLYPFCSLLSFYFFDFSYFWEISLSFDAIFNFWNPNTIVIFIYSFQFLNQFHNAPDPEKHTSICDEQKGISRLKISFF